MNVLQIEDTKPVLSSSNDKFNVKKIADSFFSTLKNSNFLVLKCYKLAIELKNIIKNKGRILMTVILILSLISLFIFCFTHNKIIDRNLKSILTSGLNNMKIFDNSESINKVKSNIKRKFKKKRKEKEIRKSILKII